MLPVHSKLLINSRSTAFRNIREAVQLVVKFSLISPNMIAIMICLASTNLGKIGNVGCKGQLSRVVHCKFLIGMI